MALVGASSSWRLGRSQRSRENRRLEPAPTTDSTRTKQKGPVKIAGWSRLKWSANDPPIAKDRLHGPCRSQLQLATRTKPKVPRKSPAGAGSYIRFNTDEAKGPAKIAGWSRLKRSANDPPIAKDPLHGPCRSQLQLATRTKPKGPRKSPAGAGSFYERSSSNGDEKHGGVHPHLHEDPSDTITGRVNQSRRSGRAIAR